MSSRVDDATAITIYGIVFWLMYFKPTMWLGPIPVYSGLVLFGEILFLIVLLMMWVWAVLTS